VSIALTPSTASVPAGLTVDLDAVATLSDGGTQDVTATAGWESSDSTGTIATVAPGGVVTAGLESGSPVTITALLGSASGTAEVTVTAPVLVSIAITPPGPSVTTGSSLQLHAGGTLSNQTSQDETTGASWSSSDETTAAFSTGTAGLITCGMTGQVTVTASIANPLSTTGGMLTATTTLTCQ
jgi:hypothetical protein